jgi:hypothetical protein
MTKQSVSCPVCKDFLGNVHGGDVEDTISKHIIWKHPEVAKLIVEIALQIEDYQAQFKKLSGMYARTAIHNFSNQNTMRALGWTEKEIDKHLRKEES